IAAGRHGPEPTGAMRGLPLDTTALEAFASSPSNLRSSVAHGATPERRLPVAELRDRLQRDMTTFAGVLRDGAGLERAAASVDAVHAALADDPAAGGRDAAELRTLLAVGRAVVTAAADR